MPQSDTQIADALPRAGAPPAPIDTATARPAEPPTRPAEPPKRPAEPPKPPADDLVEDDLLVEDVSIDGMCGVY